MTYTDIIVTKGGKRWFVLVQEDWRNDDPFSQRQGYRVDSVWKAKSEAERRVTFLQQGG
jgi:hypothetical protein